MWEMLARSPESVLGLGARAGQAAETVPRSTNEGGALSSSQDGHRVQSDVQEVSQEQRQHAKPERQFAGSGTADAPYIVEWDVDDPENPYNWTIKRKWATTLEIAFATWTVSFGSSSYSGGLQYTMADLHVSETVAVLGISLYVFGFGLGPLVFAPLSEMYGRRVVFLTTFFIFAVFNIGDALSQNIATLLACRLIGGIFGAAVISNGAGVIADIWSPRDRGMSTALYTTATYLGPVVGPIVGGFVAQNPRLGWRFNFWLMLIFSATVIVLFLVAGAESYGPVLLRWRARKLCKDASQRIYYISHFDLTRSLSLFDVLKTNLSRPFIYLFTEPIVTLIAIYFSCVYATMYALFAAYPIVFQRHRGLSPGMGGLAFLGVGGGVVLGTTTVPIQTRIYWRAMARSQSGRAPPEARLYGPMLGAILLPIGLFWFAWTSTPRIHVIVPILSGILFGFSTVQIQQGLLGYLMDSYTIYAASALAATVVLRSAAAAAFPLFAPPLYAALGDAWGASVFAFFALVCMPIPILFFRYGAWIRSKSKLALHDEEFDPRSAVSSEPDTVVAHGIKDAEKAL